MEETTSRPYFMLLLHSDNKNETKTKKNCPEWPILDASQEKSVSMWSRVQQVDYPGKML